MFGSESSVLQIINTELLMANPLVFQAICAFKFITAQYNIEQ